MLQDIVAQLPKEVEIYKQKNDPLPNDYYLEPGYICIFKGKHFIHTRATLPLKNIEKGIGFGLWVEVNETTFKVYTEAVENDALYKNFKGQGTLANDWPGFENMHGVNLTFRTIKLEDKVYITQVHDLQNRDPLFYVAMTTSSDDNEKIKMIEDLTRAYMQEV